MKPIDWSKPVVTRDGRKVRILCTDGPEVAYPVIGLMEGDLHVSEWAADGVWSHNKSNHRSDLINAPERVERWLNLYEPDGPLRSVAQIDNLEDARKFAASGVVGQVRVTFEGGRPVSVALEDAQ